MNAWIDKLIDDYYKFLKDRTAIIADSGNDWIAISTPYLGAFNDNIEIYAQKKGDKIILSDDGITIKNLDLQGVIISKSPNRKEFVDKILLTYGISCANDELIVEANENTFAQKKHNLLMAISEISDMYILNKQSVFSVFKEDVQSFLNEKEIIYTPQFISKGRTGLEFTFDFQIAGKTKEIVIKSFNSLTKTNVPNFLFSWDDVKSVREQISNKTIKGLAFVNDTEKEVDKQFIEALGSRNAECILWSKRNEPENIEKLVA
ncbi:MAG: DUF1828 domain-containing protein [Bacteroidales bacterium]|jgi:hypothetical protein|nr:DUF1828 domain-containing protein [Bacteroidales bacterium]